MKSAIFISDEIVPNMIGEVKAPCFVCMVIYLKILGVASFKAFVVGTWFPDKILRCGWGKEYFGHDIDTFVGSISAGFNFLVSRIFV